MLPSILRIMIVYLLITESIPLNPFQVFISNQEEDKPCSMGKYAKIKENGTIKCRHCSRCPKGKQIKKPCDEHSDAECEDCPSGTFNDVRAGTCRHCSDCHTGTYIKSYCTSTRDTKCRPCPKHHYNPVTNTEVCVPCSRCRTHEEFLHKCRKDRDTQCGNCKIGYFRESFTGNCLLCSPCPETDLSRHVVKECRTRLGIQHPNICWPGSYRELNSKKQFDQSFDIDYVTETIMAEQETKPKYRGPSEFTISVIVLTVCVTVMGLILASVVVIKCCRRLSNHRQESQETTSFVYDMSEQNGNPAASTFIHDCNGDSFISSEYTWSSTDENTSINTDQLGVENNVSHSEPLALFSENKTSDYVENILSNGGTLPFSDKKKNSRRKNRKRKQLEPENVCYYTIPCNPQYFSQQLYLTL